jgi:hypothetical protein
MEQAMAKKAKKKPTAKKSKATPKPPKAPPELKSYGPGWPDEVKHLQADAEEWERRYHSQRNDPKLIEGRALIDRILAAREPYFRDKPKTQPDNPKTQPGSKPPSAPVASSAEARPQQELCWRVFDKLFPDGRMPDEVELNTERLKLGVARYLVDEAKAAGKKLPSKLPGWEAVKNARRSWRPKQ